jgi:uncharacterized protein
LQHKLTNLQHILKQLGSALIAYSGGVDSTFLAAIAHDALGRDVLAVTAASPIHPPQETEMAVAQARELGIRHLIIETDELSTPLFVANDVHRCYYCKRHLLQRLRRLADEQGLEWVIEGSNCDDATEWRPGKVAIAELGIRSPLCEAGLGKDKIRALSQKRGLITWDKPSESCLATRIPYGTPISGELLQRILKAEDYLHQLGVRKLRVRHHGESACIEVGVESLPLLLERREEIMEKFRNLGYAYITLSLPAPR